MHGHGAPRSIVDRRGVEGTRHGRLSTWSPASAHFECSLFWVQSGLAPLGLHHRGHYIYASGRSCRARAAQLGQIITRHAANVTRCMFYNGDTSTGLTRSVSASRKATQTWGRDPDAAGADLEHSANTTPERPNASTQSRAREQGQRHSRPGWRSTKPATEASTRLLYCCSTPSMHRRLENAPTLASVVVLQIVSRRAIGGWPRRP